MPGKNDRLLQDFARVRVDRLRQATTPTAVAAARSMYDPSDATLSDDRRLLKASDRYAADAEGSPSRPELVRRIVRDRLITMGYFDADPLEALNDDTEQITS